MKLISSKQAHFSRINLWHSCFYPTSQWPYWDSEISLAQICFKNLELSANYCQVPLSLNLITKVLRYWLSSSHRLLWQSDGIVPVLRWWISTDTMSSCPESAGVSITEWRSTLKVNQLPNFISLKLLSLLNVNCNSQHTLIHDFILLVALVDK